MLTEQFLLELFRLAFLKKSIVEVLREHFKYQFIPSKGKVSCLKKIFKSILTIYDNTGKIPSYGEVSQHYSSDIDVQEYISKIKKIDIPDTENILTQLEEYIKLTRFQILFEDGRELFNNDKTDEAIAYVAKESEEIVRFSITQDSSYFTKIFGDFKEDMKEKQLARDSGEFERDKIPFGIQPLDEMTYGGVDAGDSACFIARSGFGKSTLLKWMGMYACRMGYNVLHVQLEGTKQEARDKYTQVWTAQKYIDIKYGNLDGLTPKQRAKLDRVVARMYAQQKDIYLYAFEKFDEASCVDIRNLVLRYYKEKGFYPDELIVDSVDLLHPGDGLKYGISTEAIKMKKENSAKKLKNMAVEFYPMRVITADQASDIPKEKWNDPGWCMTRHNVSGAKNLSNSFSYFITVNMTEAEQKNNIARLYTDKLRNYKNDDKVLKVATAYEFGRFYDNKRTQELMKAPEVEKDDKTGGKRKRTRNAE
jgi:KaiC/GvpD/RAD55 family RecA-like ATPase